ncbi:MAG: acyl-CoA thioesterase/BAAT N-terminal domain-containing protein [Sphingomonadaceae bacterium]|nr:acyl-CoA thioesterase/BAAT N-terminal domain-containing protein [Sphingomonadaceae bacterium]
MIRLTRWAAALLLALAATGAAAAARLEVSPAEVLEGEPVSIRIIGAAPGSQVTLHAQSTLRAASGTAIPFHGYATYRVGANGIVDLATAAPIAGTYEGADLRGLFWSQQRVVPEVAPLPPVLAEAPAPAPDQVLLTLQVQNRAEDRAALRFLASDVPVRREEVRAPGLIGAFYTAPGARARPVVVILHGSEGGFDYADWLGPMLVARGYSVFGLVYYAPHVRPVAGAPEALNGIPVESLERARTWLATRPEADVERFGLVGASKGGEFAMLLASTYAWIDAVAAFTPSAWVSQGFSYGSGEAGMGSSWSRGGRGLPFVPETGLAREVHNFTIPGGEVRMANVHLANLASAAHACGGRDPGRAQPCRRPARRRRRRPDRRLGPQRGGGRRAPAQGALSQAGRGSHLSQCRPPDRGHRLAPDDDPQCGALAGWRHSRGRRPRPGGFMGPADRLSGPRAPARRPRSHPGKGALSPSHKGAVRSDGLPLNGQGNEAHLRSLRPE